MIHPTGEGFEPALEIFPDTTFDAILFDMDGTLIDSTAAVERSWLVWAQEEGVDAAALFRNGHGKPAAELVASAVPQERSAASLARLTAIEASDTNGIKALPGIGTLLDSLPGGKWAIVTSSTKELAYIRLAAAGVEPPPVVVTFDDVVRGKPDPEPFLRGAEALGMNPARCLVVEDSVAGLIAGRSAGCTTLAVSGTHNGADVSRYADAVIDSFQHLVFESSEDGLRLLDNSAGPFEDSGAEAAAT